MSTPVATEITPGIAWTAASWSPGSRAMYPLRTFSGWCGSPPSPRIASATLVSVPGWIRTSASTGGTAAPADEIAGPPTENVSSTANSAVAQRATPDRRV